MQWVLEIVALIAALILWMIFIAFAMGMVMRNGGDKFPMNPSGLGTENKSVQRKLSDFQYALWIGVFSWGWGVFLVTTLSDYVEYKYFGSHDPHLSWNRLLAKLLIWTLGGFGFGYWDRRLNRGTFGKSLTLLNINELPK